MAARLLYATPTGKHPHVGYTKSLRDLEVSCKSFVRGEDDLCFSVGPVQMARSHIADVCLEKGYDFLVMHDDDMAVQAYGPHGNPLDEWHRLMDASPEVGMIGAVYLRERPCVPTVTVSHPDYQDEMCHVVSGFGAGPVEVAAVGTGFVMIRREALAAVKDDLQMFRFSNRKTRWGDTTTVGEDYDFCNRIRAKGWKVIADPRFDTCHYKDVPLRFDQKGHEYFWSDQHPDVQKHAQELRAGLPPLAQLKFINGFLAIDHTPQLMADQRRREAKTGIDALREQVAGLTQYINPPKPEAEHAA